MTESNEDKHALDELISLLPAHLHDQAKADLARFIRVLAQIAREQVGYTGSYPQHGTLTNRQRRRRIRSEHDPEPGFNVPDAL